MRACSRCTRLQAENTKKAPPQQHVEITMPLSLQGDCLMQSPPQRREQPATALNDTVANTAPPTLAPRQVPIQAAASASNEVISNSESASGTAAASQDRAQVAWNGNGSSNGAVKVYAPANAAGGASSRANSGSRTGSASALNGSLTAAFSNSDNTNSTVGNGSDLSNENNGASSNGASSNVANAPEQAAGFQQRSPQEVRKGSTWGPDAGSRGKSGRPRVVRDEIDENYEESLRLLSPLRCCHPRAVHTSCFTSCILIWTCLLARCTCLNLHSLGLASIQGGRTY